MVDKPAKPPSSRATRPHLDSSTVPITLRAGELTLEGTPVDFISTDEDTEVTERRTAAPTRVDRNRPTMTILSGRASGQVIELRATEYLLGRGTGVNLPLDDLGVSRRHARIRRWIGQAYVLEDLGSTNGTFVNGKRVDRRSLSAGDVIQIGPDVRIRFDMLDPTEAELQRNLFEGNVRDPATRLYSRSHLIDQVRLEVAHARRHESDVALMLVRVDEASVPSFESVDRVITVVAQRMVEGGQIEDFVARYDDRTIALLLRATDLGEASRRAETIVKQISGEPMVFSAGSQPSFVTVAVGISTLARLELFDDYQGLVDQARDHCERAAELGPNRVVHPGT
ncbi:MAG: FHA domain-containing protein [Myxococcota bacterium]